MSYEVRTREYLTVHRNEDIIIKSLTEHVDPGLFIQKLHKVDLVSAYMLERACGHEVMASDHIQQVFYFVKFKIRRESSKYDVFMQILKDVHPKLAEKLSKYFTTDLRLNAPWAVTGVCDWQELGRLIDYDPIKLTLLQSSGYSPERCREEMVTDWARQGDASWMKLARALDRMNEAHLAEEIRRQYLPSPEHEDDSSSSSPREDLLTVSQTMDSDVAGEMEDLSQAHPSPEIAVADCQLSERQIRATVDRHLDEVLRYINWELLVPYLKAEGLLGRYGYDHHHSKMTFFFKILPNRRPNPYTRFYKCLAEAKFFGHQLLLELF